MTKSELISKLKKTTGVEVEEFNSNSAWGFGGSYGLSFTRGEDLLKIFTACYRHAPSESRIVVRINGHTVVDALVSSKSIENAHNLFFNI